MIKPTETILRRANTLIDLSARRSDSGETWTVYDAFKLAMFFLAIKLRQQESYHDLEAALGNAVIDTQDRRDPTELTGLWRWYREFWLPARYPKLYAILCGGGESHTAMKGTTR